MKKHILILLCALLTTSCQNPPRILPSFHEPESTLEALYTLQDFKELTTTIDGHPLHLVHTGTPTKPKVLFIHGSPGSWHAWAEYLYDQELRESTFMIAMDRPGYGGSNIGKSGYSLKQQSQKIMGALEHIINEQDKVTIVGHSYGGPVALQIAIDYPDKIENMILLAPAASPDLVNIRWYNRLASIGLIKRILPTPLNHSNNEMLLLKNELRAMKGNLPQITTPILTIQGQKDWIVLPGNADFIETSLPNAQTQTIKLLKRGHFIPWEEFNLIKNEILKTTQP
jgi:pimeloyl-ACP methyl ester carboxylesterase